ncbi:MAG: glycosyltransferase family 4 protein [Candidatus Bathyarchaeia archaeon]
MRILWFNWRDWTHPWAGGAEAHVYEVTRRFAKWGHEVTLLSGEYEGCRRREELSEVEIIRKGNPFTTYLYAAKEYLQNLRERDYDVVVDDINGVPFFTPLYVREPKLAIVHHLVKEIFFQQLPWLKATIGYLAERSIPVLYRNTPFIAVSNSTREELLKFGVSERNITVVNYGREYGCLGPSEKSHLPTVLYFNRIRRYKNVDDLIRAFKIVKDEISDARLLIVGCRGDDEYENEVRALARDLRLRDVEFRGFVTGDEKKGVLGQSWVHVLPSVREGWGMSVIDAAACGTPSVAYDVPGLSCSIKNGKTGLLVPYHDVEALAGAILRILVDEELRTRFSKNAIEWSRNFDWDKTAKLTLERLRQISR